MPARSSALALLPRLFDASDGGLVELPDTLAGEMGPEPRQAIRAIARGLRRGVPAAHVFWLGRTTLAKAERAVFHRPFR
jgi:hypothetical protein